MLITYNWILVYSIITALIQINARIFSIQDTDSKELTNDEKASNENLGSEDEDNDDSQPHNCPELLLIQILLGAKDKPRYNRSKNSQCNRHFGSIFGTKIQKLLCLEKSKFAVLKRSIISPKLLDFVQQDNNRNIDKQYESSDDNDSFSEDYVDFGDFGRKDNTNIPWRHYKLNKKLKKKQETKNRRSLRVIPFLIKVQEDSKKGKLKTPKIVETIHSDTSESSNESDNHTPKRFEVMENMKETTNSIPKMLYAETSETGEKSLESSTEDSDFTNGWDSDSSEVSSVENDKPKNKKLIPDKTKTGKRDIEVENEKYGYLQGADRWYRFKDLRKRLQYFLPKRYHWRKDDLTKLGYYWYDGPQGIYAGNWKEQF